jgi:hypothetical protein
MSFIVQRPFETASDVMTGPIARLRHRLGRSQAPASRTANEEEIVIQSSAKCLKLDGETPHEVWIHGLIGKGLPFDEDSPLADGSEIGNPDIGPFRARADVDQLRARTRGRRCQVTSTSTASTALSSFCMASLSRSVWSHYAELKFSTVSGTSRECPT